MSRDHIQFFITYSCFDEIIGSPKEIRLDFNMKSDIYGQIEEKVVIESYSDLIDKKKSLHVMSLNAILANKLGLLTDNTRNEPRDIFDIWFLSNLQEELGIEATQTACSIA